MPEAVRDRTKSLYPLPLAPSNPIISGSCRLGDRRPLSTIPSEIRNPRPQALGGKPRNAGFNFIDFRAQGLAGFRAQGLAGMTNKPFHRALPDHEPDQK